MKILALDLELNQAETGAKIIEVGACVGDIVTGEVVEKYSAFVNPQEPLTEFIVQLTSITQAQVDEAGDIVEACPGDLKPSRFTQSKEVLLAQDYAPINEYMCRILDRIAPR